MEVNGVNLVRPKPVTIACTLLYISLVLFTFGDAIRFHPGAQEFWWFYPTTKEFWYTLTRITAIVGILFFSIG
jgi:hypothetical protein